MSINRETNEEAIKEITGEDCADLPTSRDYDNKNRSFVLKQMIENAKQGREATKKENQNKKYQVLEDDEIE